MLFKKVILLFFFLFQPFFLLAKSLLPPKPSLMIPMGIVNLSGSLKNPTGKLVGYPYSTGCFKDNYYVGETEDGWVIAYLLTKKQTISRFLWLYKGPKGGLSTSPLITNDYAVLAFKEGTVATVDLKTGKEKWTSKLESSFIDAPLVINEGHLFLSTFSQILYKIDFNTGSILWAYQLGMPEDVRIRTQTAPVFTNDSVFAANTEGDILNLSLDTGKLNFVFRAPFVSTAQFKNLIGPMTIHKNSLYATRYDGYAISLDLKSKGSQKALNWHVDLKATITATKVSIQDNLQYIGTSDGNVHAFELSSGKPVWDKPINIGSVSVSSIISTERYFYIAASNGQLFCFNRETKNLLEVTDLQTQVLTDLVQRDKTLLVPAQHNSLFYQLHIF